MYRIFSILAGLVLLTGTTQGMRISYSNMDAQLEVAVSDDNYLQYPFRQEKQKTESIASDNG